MHKKQIFGTSAKTDNPSDAVMNTDALGTKLCCFNQKIIKILVQSPEGEQIFHVCEKHRNLDYFLKYKISEEKIE